MRQIELRRISEVGLIAAITVLAFALSARAKHKFEWKRECQLEQQREFGDEQR